MLLKTGLQGKFNLADEIVENLVGIYKVAHHKSSPELSTHE